ncbi:uncharacterized protein LOC123551926 [Mercenaria mercenaria]|uniref:uncharacterized protein LOC123551926 n=1 Tax=Mercenaria mercenaria TaxID=6596 RepID=UPI00234E9FD2|nr:uncharacterized protein LOC123551926 [Mercenaria mercenaria]
MIKNVPDTRRKTTYNWTILLTVNNGFYDFFQNWWWHFRKLDISVPVSVIAEDDIVFEKLTSLSDSSIEVRRSEYISIDKTVSYDSMLYKKMVSARPTYILMYLKNGTNVIYSDLDTVWLQNPMPYLKGNFDIWSQLDAENYLCTGFLAIKSKNVTLKFIQKWEDALRDTPTLNQPVFNWLVKQSSIKIKQLHSKRFPSGKQYFDQFSKTERLEVVVVHNNWIIGHDKKVKRFQNVNLWVNETISLV